jgi:hypothetical protein
VKEKLLCLSVLVLIFLTAGIAPTIASAAETNPTVTGPIIGGCSPSCPTPPGPADGIHMPEAFLGVSNQQPFIDADYTEEEYFFTGTATAFERDPAAPAWTSTGTWTAEPSTTIPPIAYTSRMIVRRPTDPRKFNGIVVVEWLNVTAAIDLAPDYGYYQAELLRDGFIWVGVSAQEVGVNGSPFLPGFGLKSWDPVRYGSLNVDPSDNYSYDIYSQAAEAVRHPVGINPLGSSAYRIKEILADGESQSAGRMVTYFNAIQPLAEIFDGFLIHSTGSTGAGLFAGAGGSVPSPSNLRTDQQPALVFETETDTVGYFAARQPNSRTYRLWEGAGTAHVDLQDLDSFMADPDNQEPSYPTNVCTLPDNSAHEDYLMNAALVHLSEWTRGIPPPTAPPIDVVSGAIQRNSLGIALGGIRLPEMNVPTETEQGVGNTGTAFCILFGTTTPLPVPLSSLYKNHFEYVAEFFESTLDLSFEGFLLPPDAVEAITKADQSDVP